MCVYVCVHTVYTLRVIGQAHTVHGMTEGNKSTAVVVNDTPARYLWLTDVHKQSFFTVVCVCVCVWVCVCLSEFNIVDHSDLLCCSEMTKNALIKLPFWGQDGEGIAPDSMCSVISCNIFMGWNNNPHSFKQTTWIWEPGHDICKKLEPFSSSLGFTNCSVCVLTTLQHALVVNRWRFYHVWGGFTCTRCLTCVCCKTCVWGTELLSAMESLTQTGSYYSYPPANLWGESCPLLA